MIISIYDDWYGYDVAVNGIGLEVEERRKIKNDFYCISYYSHKEDVVDFMKKHSCDRLIVCENGSIEIFEDKKEG